MQAVVYEGAQRVTLKDVPRPTLRDETIILRVSRCAICGTDIKAITHGIASIKPPVILGHEIAGQVAEVGKRVEGFRVGDRISLAPSLPCGQCAMCGRGFYNLCNQRLPIGTIIDGGFAEYLEVPARGIALGYVVKIPDSLTDDEAALCEPLACVINPGRGRRDRGRAHGNHPGHHCEGSRRDESHPRRRLGEAHRDDPRVPLSC
jgi:L-iditol 2-dehydrogenase